MRKFLAFITNFFRGLNSHNSSGGGAVVGVPQNETNTTARVGLFPDIARYEKCDFSVFDKKHMIIKATDGGKWIDPTIIHKNV